ncbi:MAG TPA: transcription antitermination factor NusB [Opitutaceae bacterium]|nr:transcription antitermination factor NusB [Opitutaceae bacterium]
MEGVPPALQGAERARCQRLVYGVVRHAGRLEAALRRRVSHLPRFETRAILYLAGFELLEEGGSDAGKAARIVHHAVEQAKSRASAAEARLVNAVARRLAEDLGAQLPPPEGAPAAQLADYYSHPEWLVRRWLGRFGAGPTRALLEWNQRPAPVHVRWRDPAETPAWLKPTPWRDYFEVEHGHAAELEGLLAAGRLYVQDPATRLAAELLGPRGGEDVLDACAAPGGKALLLADAMGRGLVVALDLPGERQERLRENAAKARGTRIVCAAGDVRRPPSRWRAEAPIPEAYAAVLLDAPCTNTGVMRHRVDVKWRLQEGDFGRHAGQQRALLEAAARCVAPGGRLVYSTCSIDPEENEDVVEAFLSGEGKSFRLEAQRIARPWEDGHDGAGVFRLRRV